MKAYQKIFRSPINTSISKHLYSIPQSKRFQETKGSPCLRGSYNMPSTFNPRSTSFGFGNRTHLQADDSNPPVGLYDTRNKLQRRRGFSFGQQTKVSFIDVVANKTGKLPAPWKYSTPNHYSTAYSFRSKYQDPLEKHKSKLGPGEYNIKSSLNKNGSYFNSKYRSSGCGKFSNQKRFDKDIEKGIGPGKYQIVNSINKNGIYFDSKIRSSCVNTFQKSPRPPLLNHQQAPPPGSYYYFSQFPPPVKTYSTKL